ncbi:MAG: FMN-binding protein [Flavobacteriaceae bacterium]
MRRFRNILLLLLGLNFLSSGLDFNSSALAKRIQKRMNKEITSVFSVENFTLESSTIKIKQTPFLINYSLQEIKVDNQLQGYAFLGTAPSKTDTFEYLVLFDPTFIIKKASVLVYREDYGGEIASKRWLSQFVNKQDKSTFVYGDNISAISGATISVQSMTTSMNHVFSSLKQVTAGEGK